jgi:hypothetical protein
MRLENEPSSQLEQSGSVRLTATEMDEVLNRAIARDSQGLQVEPRTATLGDAVEIAQELGISEEQVRASLVEVRAEKLQSGRRDEKRAVVRARRRRTAGVAIAGMAALTAFVLFGSAGGAATIFTWFLIAAGWLSVAWLILRAQFASVSDKEADAVELTPVAGTCRVCGAPASSPQSTFCDEHRYQGPRP